jgi:isocitrate dehydrogenase
MLEFMGWNEAAEKIIVALEQAILHQQVTIDFASALGVESLSTSQFAEALIARI